ncbi:MAG: osmoprotectant NAGGN system M42 family peptidase [Bdellovibrionales bacterium]|nr:osmoprotectant NAGGN system M42 family peptidase [Bdellovibrionales bacterium]
MKNLQIDDQYMVDLLLRLLEIPSPSGYTDAIVHFVGEELKRLGIPFELTRRGAVRAHIAGRKSSPDRAIVAHLDTLGAMVQSLKSNGRLEIVPIGTWSSRFAEGARVSVFTDTSSRRGSILPLKASGHTFNLEIDTQPVNWEQIEVRIDEVSECKEDLQALGFNVGDFVAIDPNPEVLDSGYIVSRHLDDKAGVAIVFAAAKAILERGEDLPVDCHLLFTLVEELGHGASAVLHGEVAEMVSIDNATPAQGQNSTELGVTIAMKDSTGPFDYHLTHKLISLCEEHKIPFERDVFKYYACDAASAIEAGNDIRTALMCFGVDASHGYERTHRESLIATARLVGLYMQSPPTFRRDKDLLGSLSGFPTQPE